MYGSDDNNPQPAPTLPPNPRRDNPTLTRALVRAPEDSFGQGCNFGARYPLSRQYVEGYGYRAGKSDTPCGNALLGRNAAKSTNSLRIPLV